MTSSRITTSWPHRFDLEPPRCQSACWGEVCERPAGHTGCHSAHDPDGGVYQIWDDMHVFPEQIPSG